MDLSYSLYMFYEIFIRGNIINCHKRIYKMSDISGDEGWFHIYLQRDSMLEYAKPLK